MTGASTLIDATPMFALTEDQQAIRIAVRELVEARVAPYAGEVDEQARFPEEAFKALAAADFDAPHIPEEFGGAGADALATCLVIEEVARGCASSSLIPAVNKLGTLPLLIAGSSELKQHYLPQVARDHLMFSYCLSETESGSDAAAMRTRAVRDGDDYVI
ncbi:MAG: acyl-CoA dehydrogenase family protein, partial [Actinomycetales bacterium]